VRQAVVNLTRSDSALVLENMLLHDKVIVPKRRVGRSFIVSGHRVTV
jgi:hypothetical protein